MTIKRLVVLQVILGLGLGCVHLVPAASKRQPSGVMMELPEVVGQWDGKPQAIEQAEKDGLAADTTFARRIYSNAFGDRILVSIVLAGEDPDNSIHRPERCLPAQGWTVLDSREVTMKTNQISIGQLRATRLHNERKFPDEQGNIHTVYNLNYYWFIGYTAVTPSHIQRALLDIRDRVIKGYDQRWAYVTVASTVTEGLTKFGRSEQATDQMIQDFIMQMFPKITKQTALHSGQ